MDYEEKYKRALERAKYALNTDMDDSGHWAVNYIFPELKESEDERIRKEIVDFITASNKYGTNERCEAWLNWLEKQREHKPYGQRKECEDCQFNYAGECKGYCALKRNEQTQFDYEHANIPQKDFSPIEPKFKVGDWIANGGANPCYVKSIFGDYYELCSCEGFECTKHIIDVDYIYHLWTINDAKDGDVLVDVYGNIGIYKSHDDFDWTSYCSLGCNGGFQNFKVEHENENTHPATKEQRDLLFQKMKEAGYEWDADKKELSKQTLKITPKFCVGQVITDNNGTWYKITNVKCLDDWYYEVYDVCEDTTHHELCSIIDEKFRENRFVGEIKKMMGD